MASVCWEGQDKQDKLSCAIRVKGQVCQSVVAVAEVAAR